MKRKIATKFAWLILAATTTVSMTACGNQTDDNEQEKTQEVRTETDENSAGQPTATPEEENIVLTIAIPDNPKVEDYNTNEMTLLLEKELGYDLQFETYPSTDYSTKINAMVQGGDKLPDIVIGDFDKAMVYSWAMVDAITPLTEYYKDPGLAVNLSQHFADPEIGDFRANITFPNGEIYTIPKIIKSRTNEQGAKLWVNTEVLERLGLPVPTTMEEFENTLREVTAAEPDMIGLVGFGQIASADARWFDYLMNSFVYCDSNANFMKAEDGQLSFSYMDPGFKEGLKYMEKLVAEGLIAKETLSQDLAAWKTMINSFDVFSICYIGPDSFTDDRRNTFEALPPMKGPEGIQYARWNPTVPYGGMVVSAECEHPEAAFRLGDLLTRQDYTISNRWGKQGEDWDYFEEYVQTLDDYKEEDWTAANPFVEKLIIVYDDASFWSGSDMQNRSWLAAGPQIRGYSVADGRTSSAESLTAYTVHMSESGLLYPEYYPEEYVTSLTYTQEEQEEISEIFANATSYISTTCTTWLLGEGDIDGEWDGFQEELKKIGVERALEIAQSAYDRSHK